MVQSKSKAHSVALKEDYLPFLDGLRGLAALWVVISHAQLLSGRKFAVLSRGDVAVELFMIMSGFLMAYHYYVRQDKEPWEEPKTWIKFYIRRFLRIAPLYYFLFLVYWIIGPTLGEFRQEIGQHFYSAITEPARYTDHSWTNMLMHLSFLFGMSPEYSFRTPMPDWSIGLEMQFYFVFPFLMLLFRKNYFLPSAAGLFLAAHAVNHVWAKEAFRFPSFLTLGLIFFLIGMLLATYNRYKGDGFKAPAALGGALILAWLTQEKLIVLIAILIAILLNPNLTVNPVRRLIYQSLSNRLTTWMADMSYCVYLLHLAVMTPIAHFCARNASFVNLPGRLRFLIVFVPTVVITYALSTVFFRVIEKNGIMFGKNIVRKI